jgi:hypothetical protein
MHNRTIVWFLGAGLMAGAFFAAELLHAQAVQECFRFLLRQRQRKCPGHTTDEARELRISLALIPEFGGF